MLRHCAAPLTLRHRQGSGLVQWLRSMFGLLALACSAAHGAAGAFGWVFGEPIAEAQLGATSARLPGAALLEPLSTDSERILLSELSVAAAAQAPGRWHYLAARDMPDQLAALRPRLAVQVGHDRQPVWFVATFDAVDCPATLGWLRDTLRKKYRLDQLPIETGETYTQRVAFASDDVDIAAGCAEQTLRVEYRSRTGAQVLGEVRGQWLAHQQAMRERQRLAQQSLGRNRNATRAIALVGVDADRLEHVLGLYVEQRIKEVGSFDADRPTDIPLPPTAPAPFSSQIAQVELDPQGYLIRCDIVVADPDANSHGGVDGLVAPALWQSKKSHEAPRYLHHRRGLLCVAPPQGRTEAVVAGDRAGAGAEGATCDCR